MKRAHPARGAIVALAGGVAVLCGSLATAQSEASAIDLLKTICIDTRTYMPAVKTAAAAHGFKESQIQQGARTVNQLRAELPGGKKITVATGATVSLGGGNSPLYRLGRAEAWYCSLHLEPRAEDVNAQVQAFVGAPKEPMTGNTAAYLFTVKDGKVSLVQPKADGEYDGPALYPAVAAGELNAIEVKLYPGRTEVAYSLFAKLSEATPPPKR